MLASLKFWPTVYFNFRNSPDKWKQQVALHLSHSFCWLQLFSSTDRPTASHGEVAELLRQGPHHGGGLDGHRVLQPWCQDGAL